MPVQRAAGVTAAEESVGESANRNGLTNEGENGNLQSSDVQIGRSVGAKAKNYPVRLPNGEYTVITEGTRVTNVQVIAGKGRHRQIDEIYGLLDTAVLKRNGKRKKDLDISIATANPSKLSCIGMKSLRLEK